MRPLRRTPVPPGAAGITALVGPLQSALDGTGPAIAPVPVTSVTVSDEYVQRIMGALRPDDPTRPLESEEIAVVLATSGSTGDPSGVLHTSASLNALNDAVNGTAAPQWIAAIPLTSMGGFNVLVRALAAGREPIGLPSLGGAAPFTPAAFAEAVARAATSDVRVSLVAAQVRRLLADPEGIEALRACTQILVGAGPTPPSVLDAAHALGIPLTLTYGSTETCGGCVYDGRPLPGVTVRIIGSGNGHVVIDGPMLARGYRCDPARTAERFGPDGFHTMDLGTLDHGLLTLHGRIDDIVIVNGVNVSLRAVERAVEQCPAVAVAAVISLPGDEPELVAVVVARDLPEDLRAQIDTCVAHSLGTVAVPRRVAVVDEFPALPNGKLDRSRLVADVTDGGLAWLR